MWVYNTLLYCTMVLVNENRKDIVVEDNFIPVHMRKRARVANSCDHSILTYIPHLMGCLYATRGEVPPVEDCAWCTEPGAKGEV